VRPGALGVCIGAIAASATTSPSSALRPLDDINPTRAWPSWSRKYAGSHKLGVGTMGSRQGDMIGCKIAAAKSPAASFFRFRCLRLLGVSAPRRARRSGERAIKQWLYATEPAVERLNSRKRRVQTERREIRLEAPLSEEKVRALKVGDVVLITAPWSRHASAAHEYLHIMIHPPTCAARFSTTADR